MNARIKFGLAVVIAFAAGALLVFYLHKPPEKLAAETDEKPAAENAAPAEIGTVKLDAETQARIGLQTTNPAASDWQPETKAYGLVLDPAPLVESLMDLGRAETAFDSSHQELERAKLLKKDSNISERAFQDAETNYRQNFQATMASYYKIQSVWGKKIAGLTGPIVVPPGTERKPDELMEKFLDSAILIRVDLPAGTRLENWPPQIQSIIPLGEDAAPVTAVSFFDELPALDSLTQQREFLLLADQSSTNRLTPGEAVTAFLKSLAAPVNGVVIPSAAILRHEGKTWIYVQSNTNEFSRVEISTDKFADNGWFVSENLSATNRIVVSGAQTLLSAELTGGSFNAGGRD